MSLSFDKLAEKATWSKLTQEEIEYVTRTFYDSKPGHDQNLADCIYILGRIGADQHKATIEKYLFYPADAHVSAVTLRILCLYWKYTGEYLNQIVSFIKGVDWDEDDEVRMMAFSSLGEYLRKKSELHLIKLLTDFVEDPTKIEGYLHDRDYARVFLQACAYQDLAKALGRPSDEIAETEDVEKVIKEGCVQDLILVHEARAFLAKQ